MTELGIGAVNPNRRRTSIPSHHAQAHVRRLVRRKRRIANTVTTARTTRMFIVSLSWGRRELSLRPARPEAHPARRPGPEQEPVLRLARPEQEREVALHPVLLQGPTQWQGLPLRPARPLECSSDDSSGA